MSNPYDPSLNPPKPDASGLSNDDRTWGMLAHLSPLLAGWLGGFAFLGPLIIWLIYKDKSAFVADQAKEALNFHIAVMIVALVSIITIIGPVVVVIGAIIFSIMAAMEANKGVWYRYPYTIRFIS
jgi:uncharacterized Tic20 family protein